MQLPHPEHASPYLDVYIDETSQTKHRYLVLGALAIESRFAPTLSDMINDLKASAGIKKEMKWGRVSDYHLDNYRALVDLFFDSPARFTPMEFHTAAVDMSRRDELRHNHGSKEIGFNKELYQIAMKMWRLYPDHLFHLYPDERKTPQTTEETRLILNRGAHKKNTRRQWPFRRMHMLDSKNTAALQLVDVLLGGTAYRINGHHTAADASEAKCMLSEYILDRAGIRNPLISTATSGKFTVWHRRLQ